MLGAATLGLGLVAVGFAPSVLFLFATAVLPVLGFAMTAPSLASLLSRWTSAEHQGATLGINQAASSLARIVGPLVGNSLLGMAAAGGKKFGHLRTLDLKPSSTASVLGPRKLFWRLLWATQIFLTQKTRFLGVFWPILAQKWPIRF